MAPQPAQNGKIVPVGNPNETEEQAINAVMERVMLYGDLSLLTAPQRILYYRRYCESLGLNWLTKPFDFMWVKDPQDKTRERLILYDNATASAQLRDNRKITITSVTHTISDGLVIVTVAGATPDGRTDFEVSAVPLEKEEWINGQRSGAFTPLGPTEKANAFMKAVTKAKRRLTRSLAGLNMPDIDDVESGLIKGSRMAIVDHETGSVVQPRDPSPYVDLGQRLKAAGYGMNSLKMAGVVYTITALQALKDEEYTALISKMEELLNTPQPPEPPHDNPPPSKPTTPPSEPDVPTEPAPRPPANDALTAQLGPVLKKWGKALAGTACPPEPFTSTGKTLADWTKEIRARHALGVKLLTESGLTPPDNGWDDLNDDDLIAQITALQKPTQATALQKPTQAA